MLKRGIGIVLGLVAILGAVAGMAPWVLGYKLRQHPGVLAAGACRWSLQDIHCTVHYHRDFEWGSFDLPAGLVSVQPDKTIRVTGPALQVTVTGMPQRSHTPRLESPQGFRVVALIQKTTIQAPQKGLWASIDGLRVSGAAVTWKALKGAAKLYGHEGSIEAAEGSYDRINDGLGLGSLYFRTDVAVPGSQEPLRGYVDGAWARREGSGFQMGAPKVVVVNVATLLESEFTLEGDFLFGTTLPTIQHPWLALSPGRTAVSLDPVGGLGVAADMGRLSVSPKGLSVEASCDQAGKALGLPDQFKGDVKFSVDWTPKEPTIKLKSSCELSCQSPRMAGLKGAVTYRAYRADGVTRFDRSIGPRAPGWYPLDGLPEGVAEWWVRMEDPGFWSHPGVIPLALQVSLQQNLKEKRFARGGSTLTMQLVRNLWLERTKSLTRKGQELLLSWAVERCLTKEQILEWYLNVVEFGPDQYGIAAGSQYHYGVQPMFMTPLEGFYLATIMPNPRKARRGSDSPELAAQRARKFVASGWLPPDTLEKLGVSSGLAEEQDGDLEPEGL